MIREPYSKHSIGDGIFYCVVNLEVISREFYIFFIMREKIYIDHWVCKEDTEDSKGRDTRLQKIGKKRSFRGKGK